MLRPLWICFCLILCAALSSGQTCTGGLITVLGSGSGSFGAPVSGSVPLFPDIDTISANVTYQISASGGVGIGGSTIVSPFGLDIVRASIIGPFPEGFTPLEEGILDAGGSVPTMDHLSTVPSVGALIAAFVPSHVESVPGFGAFNADLGGSIDATELFLVGDSLQFTASESGRLYFGINEGFVSNNSGAFLVNVAAVPEPGTFAAGLIAMALILFRRIRFPRNTNS